jgi:hypothetical protein
VQFSSLISIKKVIMGALKLKKGFYFCDQILHLYAFQRFYFTA